MDVFGHVQGFSDQQPSFSELWLDHRGCVKCVLGSRPRSGLDVNARAVAAEPGKYTEQVLASGVGRLKPAEIFFIRYFSSQ
jgi:hypothetical protein